MSGPTIDRLLTLPPTPHQPTTARVWWVTIKNYSRGGVVCDMVPPLWLSTVKSTTTTVLRVLEPTIGGTYSSLCLPTAGQELFWKRLNYSCSAAEWRWKEKKRLFGLCWEGEENPTCVGTMWDDIQMSRSVKCVWFCVVWITYIIWWLVIWALSLPKT